MLMDSGSEEIDRSFVFNDIRAINLFPRPYELLFFLLLDSCLVELWDYFTFVFSRLSFILHDERIGKTNVLIGPFQIPSSRGSQVRIEHFDWPISDSFVTGLGHIRDCALILDLEIK